MTADEFRALALAYLDRCDEADDEQWLKEQPDADWFADAHARWLHAREAFPGMSWEEFGELEAKRNRKGTRQRPKMSSRARADEAGWRAVRDADRIKAFWATLKPERPRPNPPMHPHQIAADRHGVTRQLVDDRAKRPDSRRVDKIAARK